MVSTTQHAMTIDVEDYYQVSAFEGLVSREQWPAFESRVERNTDVILDMLNEHNVKATFFVLGCVAEQHPTLAQRIAAEGHEIASHGFSHRLIYTQTPAQFREETERAKKLLEDQVQTKVLGYRAASYSITNRSLWALDELSRQGFEYDSSIFPVVHDRYGIPDAPATIHRVGVSSGSSLIEYPLSAAPLWGMNIPAAGGGYFRLYPYAVSRYLLRRTARIRRQPTVFYFHPWEIDPGQPRIRGASALSRFRHYLNLGRFASRLDSLLTDFRFGRMRDVIDAHRAGEHDRLPVHHYQ